MFICLSTMIIYICSIAYAGHYVDKNWDSLSKIESGFDLLKKLVCIPIIEKKYTKYMVLFYCMTIWEIFFYCILFVDTTSCTISINNIFIT